MTEGDAHPDEPLRLALVLERNTARVAGTLRDDTGAASPMSALASARAIADATERATRALVERARAEGRTWQEIGELLATTRQAAQQRFAAPAGDERDTGLARRAAAIAAQMNAGDWDAATADWAPVMFEQEGPERVRAAWLTLRENAGALEAVGAATVVRRGPYRIADVPLVFAHGPMTARVTFTHNARVCGLFLLTPDAG